VTAALTSVIIPCHNAGRWLKQTLESALTQTWPAVEIIVVNDGSTDDSLTVAEGFAGRGVRVVDQPNRGASAARNHGLRLARGDFIQFLDADDLISPDKVGAQIELLAGRPAGTVATCAWGRFASHPAAARFVDEAVFRDFAPVDFLVLAADTGAMMHPSCWLLPRAVAERAGPWDETLSLNDDGEYFCRTLLASKGMAYSATGRSYYRSGLAGSLSQQRSERARRSQFRSIELITGRLLAAEDSPRTRRAAANYFQRFIYDFFPAPADLMQQAAARVAALGGTTLGSPPMGGRTAALARLLGWKNVWRLKHYLKR
jgi:glycosyltransferase involved in cell wall biosynthesis